jgi:hypothetical protein
MLLVTVVTDPYVAKAMRKRFGSSVIAARVLTVSMFSSSGLAATISALIWIVISAFTGAPAAFVILGALLCGLVVFVVGFSIRRAAIPR